MKFRLRCQFKRIFIKVSKGAKIRNRYNQVPNFVCVLINERYKTYQTGFSFCPLSHATGVVLWGTGVPRGPIVFFFKYGHVAYQIDGDDEQNRMQVKFSS